MKYMGVGGFIHIYIKSRYINYVCVHVVLGCPKHSCMLSNLKRYADLNLMYKRVKSCKYFVIE